jgi:hypothetical protein
MRFGLIGRNLRNVSAVALLAAGLPGIAVTASAQETYVFGQISLFAGNFTNGLVAADFNGDGRPDLAVSYFSVHSGQSAVSIYLGQPAGGFVYSATYDGYEAFALVTGDFNGDGKPDLALISGAFLQVFIGNGDGTFQLPATYSIPFGTYAVDGFGQIAVGDYNGDGKLDVAIVDGVQGAAAVLLGNGDGTFQPFAQVTDNGSPTAIVAGDFNGDGKLDLVTNDLKSTNLSVLLGNGDGTFQAPVSISTGYTAQSLVAGNFNNNANLDLAFEGVDNLGNSVVILLGNGNGTFQPPFEYSAGSESGPLATAQLNSDGNLDLVTATGPDAYVLLGNGDGTFQQAVGYATGTSVASGVVVADFNGDGAPDLAIGDNGSDYVPVVLGRGDGTLELRSDYTIGGDTRAFNISTADFTANGILDLAVPGPYYGGLSTLLGNGNGTFPPSVFEASFMGGSATPGDFNGDGKADLAFNESPVASVLEILLSNGDGTFTAAGSLPLTFETSAVGDFNGDGKLDVAAADSAANSVAVMLGNGDGTLQAPAYYATAAGPSGAAVGDFNGDDIPDLALTACTQGVVSILLGNGDGTFKTHVDFEAGTCPGAIVTGDFNQDGKTDLAVSNYSDVAVLLGNGDGTFQAPVNYSAPGIGQLTAGDFNGDGKLDLAAVPQSACSAPGSPGVVFVLFGNGDGTLQSPVTFATQTCPVAFASGDFNGDGAPDLAVLDDQGPDGNTVISVLLDGPFIALFPVALTFPVQSVGTTSTPQTVTITNPGAGKLSVTNISASGDFSQTNNCPSSLSAQANCTVTVTFTPTTGGTRSGTLSITDTGVNSPQSIALTGTGGSEISVSPASLSFALQSIGTVSTPQVVTVTNNSGIQLNFTAGPAITGPNSSDFVFCAPMLVPGAVCFYPSFGDCSVTPVLEPGGYCTVGIGFDPTAGGTRSATLSFTDSASGSPQMVPLSGLAPEPIVSLSPPTLNFGDQPVGTSSHTQLVTLTNTGNGALTVTSVTVSGDYGAGNTCRTSVPVGGNCLISVVFKPASSGTRTGTVTITDNAANSPQTIALTGAGTTPAVTLAPTNLSFGTELAGQSSVATPVTLTNTGAAPLAISSIGFGGSNAGDFSQQNNCGTSVSADATCTISIIFKPAAGGSRSATLTVADDASGSPQAVTLSGTGQDFAISVVGASSATVTPGGSVSYTLQLSSQGGLAGAVMVACSGAPAGATCSLTGASPVFGISLPPSGSSAPFVIGVTTTAAGTSWRLRPRSPREPRGPWPIVSLITFLALAGLALLGLGRAQPRPAGDRPFGRLVVPMTIAALTLALALIVPGCGGGATGPMQSGGTPAGTYPLTVTATYASSGATMQHTATLTLTVQ